MSKVTTRQILSMKQSAEKIAMLTAYDHSFAKILDQQAVDIILVGDSLGMVIQGHPTTIPVTLDDMIYHSKAVGRACKRALLLVDLPFLSYAYPQQAVKNAARLMQEGGAEMVKLEGGEPQIETVRHLAAQGIPVCAHLGLQPQSVHKLGGYRVQGREVSVAKQIEQDAKALQDAGADMLLLECVPVALAKQITLALDIPVIGIGAGRDCDGQVLVLHDMLGITDHPPKFTQNFLQCDADNAPCHTIPKAVAAYVNAVKQGHFPSDEQCFL
ncbi:MAG TPA: 3-methyl-2-oxobutanoate hydroxymethyltransferase [Thiothrix sp.]|nr:3-methyl-2-oxobutanoate hydroxymethyltransferase [Thiothrix sp.]